MGQSSTSSGGYQTVPSAAPISSQVAYDYARNGEDPYRLEGVSAGTRPVTASTAYTGSYFNEPQDPQPATRETIVPTELQPEQSFLVEEPTAPSNPSANRNDVYGEDMMPVAGAATATPVTYQPTGAPQADEPVYLDGGRDTSHSQYESRDHTEAVVTPPVASKGLVGLERDDARDTGAPFPVAVRHNTAMSVSQLHVPGKFPKEV